MKKRLLLLNLVFPLFILAQSPGGVSQDLNYWLRADAGTTTFFDNTNKVTRVFNWANQAPGSSNSVSQTPDFTSPIFNENALNFNPSLSFDGNNDAIVGSNGWDSNTVILIFNPAETVTPQSSVGLILTFQIAPGAFADSGIAIGNSPALACQNTFFINSGDNDLTSPEYLACIEDASFSSDDPFMAVCRQNAAGTLSEHRLWGADRAATIINPSEYGIHTDRPFTVGRRHSSNSFFFEGDVVEAISYSSRIAGTDINRIESYLAIKYGIALDQSSAQDYISSSGATIYDANGTFNDFDQNIAGIGRDDASGLDQRQSQSSMEGALVTIGNGEIAVNNASNPNNFDDDLSFAVWGHNGESTSLGLQSTICMNNTQVECFGFADLVEYMPRVWRLQETNDIGELLVQVSEPLFNGDSDFPVILISEDEIIDDSDEVFFLEFDGQGNFSRSINFENGNHFTFGIAPPILSVEEFNTQNLTIFPNPTSGQITFEGGDEIITQIDLFDVTGKLVRQIENTTARTNADLSSLQSGLYFANVHIGDEIIAQRIIIDN